MKLVNDGENNTITITQKIKKIGQILVKHKLMLVTAESCTGGGLSYYFTSVSGSSKWFERGFVVYSNLAKSECLQVLQKTISQYGAVSKNVVIQMAAGALKNSCADISIAITGIAGPKGGSLKKPVGTVWFAIGLKNGYRSRKIITFHQQFSGNRKAVIEKSILFIISKLFDSLMLRID